MKKILSFISNSSSSSFVITGFDLSINNVSKQLSKSNVLCIMEGRDSKDKIVLTEKDLEEFEKNKHHFEDWKFFFDYELFEDGDFDFELGDVEKISLVW